MKTLELMILSELHKKGYKLNEEMTDVKSVIEYLEIFNADSTPDNVYTPEDWVSDTINISPEYIIKEEV